MLCFIVVFFFLSIMFLCKGLHTDASTTGLQLFYNEFEAYAPDGP